MKNERGIVGKLMKSKMFVFLFLFGVVFMMGSGIAFYVLTHQSTTTYTIQGGVSAFGITSDLSPVTISVNESLTNVQQIILENDNSNIAMSYNLSLNVTNLDPSNCDEVGDVSFLLEKNATEIPSGSNFNMSAGTNTFNFTATSVNDRACPQTIDVTIDFTE